ncbi:HlyC/CorC family transporter [bacterium]|nr:HlyC/CorC family transporter [bacterium]
MIADILLVLAILMLLGFSAFFSGSETALFALDHNQRRLLRKRQDRPARTVAFMLDRLQEVLATILVGNTLVNIVLAVLATRLFLRHLGPERGPLVSTLATTLVVLLFGEILPKSIAVQHPRNTSLRIAPRLLTAHRTLGPVAGALERLSLRFRNVLQRVFPGDRQGLQEEDLLALVKVAMEEGPLGEKEMEMVNGVFELGDTPVSETMTPRVDIFLLEDNVPIREAVEKVREEGYSKIPIFRESPDRVVGILHAADLLGRENSEEAVSTLSRSVRFCPESQMAGPLLGEMLDENETLAVVLDEYGSLAGLAALEDLFEILIGNILNRRDFESQRFYMPDENTLIASARMELEEASEILRQPLSSGESETLGGYLMEQLGEVPEEGSVCEIAGLRWTVLDAEGPALRTLKLERLS